MAARTAGWAENTCQIPALSGIPQSLGEHVKSGSIHPDEDLSFTPASKDCSLGTLSRWGPRCRNDKDAPKVGYGRCLIRHSRFEPAHTKNIPQFWM